MMKINCICLLLLLCSTVYAQKTLTGQVVDVNGEPIVGASVRIKGTDIFSITDLDGHYFLRNVGSDNDILFAYIGHIGKKIKYQGQDTINVVLKDKDYSIVGLTVGGGFSEVNAKLENDEVSQTLMPFLKAGLTFEIPLKNHFFIVPELVWKKLWGRNELINGGVINSRNYDEYHIEVPVNLMKKIHSFIVFAGVYAGYVWQGKSVWQDFLENKEFSYWDAGVNLGVGFEITHFFVKMQGQYALIKQKLPIEGISTKSLVQTTLGISVGYLF